MRRFNLTTENQVAIEIKDIKDISDKINSIDETLKSIENMLRNLKVSNTPNWGLKISSDQFEASENIIRRQQTERHKESENNNCG